MRIYVACLASYNNGVLHGRWIDASEDVDAMQEEVSAMLRESKFPNVMVPDYVASAEKAGWTRNAHNGHWIAPIGNETRIYIGNAEELCEDEGLEIFRVPSAEEYAIHDMEGLPSSFGEDVGLQTVADYVELMEEFDHIDADAIAAIYDDCRDMGELAERLRDNFVGIYDSFRDYADESADEMLACHDIKDDNPLSRYFDYAAWARDLAHDMHVIDVPSGVAIFHAA